jgi:plastocyanin
MRTIIACFALALALSACSSPNPVTDTGPPPVDAFTPPTDTGTPPTDTGAPPADAPDPNAFPNCPNLAAYTTTGTAVTITGFAYTPPCLEVLAGTTVMMDATAFHPLTRAMAGTAGNPIPMGAMTPQMVTFPSEGFFPYYCQIHGSEAGGMYGVIHVVAGP